MLVQGKLLSFGDDLSDAFEIRKAVFVEEMGNSPEIEFDDKENTAVHAVIYEETAVQQNQKENLTQSESKIAVATGRMVYDGETCKVDHVAVLKNFRGMQYEELTVRMLLNKAFISGIDEVTVNAPLSMIELYREIGFHTNEDKIMEQGKPYCNMFIRRSDFTRACNKYRKI